MDESLLPQGMRFALSRKPGAMEQFLSLPESKRQALIQRARQAQSRDEMRRILSLLD